MRCRKVRKLLGPFIDEELSEKRRRGMASHLEGCPACRRQLDSIRKVEALSRQLMQAEPDQAYWETFLPRLRAKIARSGEESAWWRVRETLGKLLAPPIPWVRIAGAVATALLVFILSRAVIRHEVRMERIRALPKKSLTEQARVDKEKPIWQEDVEMTLPGALPKQLEEARAPIDQNVTKASGVAPMEKKMEPSTVSPPSTTKSFQVIDESAYPSEQTPTGEVQKFQVPTLTDERVQRSKAQELPTLHRGGREEKTLRSMAATDRAFGLNHWRQQILLWQDFIKAHPRSDQLGQIYLHLAESLYQLALLTQQREDLLRALEAYRAALDFADEEAARRPLRSRIQELEARLRKK